MLFVDFSFVCFVRFVVGDVSACSLSFVVVVCCCCLLLLFVGVVCCGCLL